MTTCYQHEQHFFLQNDGGDPFSSQRKIVDEVFIQGGGGLAALPFLCLFEWTDLCLQTSFEAKCNTSCSWSTPELLTHL